MVSIDRNNNGLPDDEWYELAGSEYHKPETRHGFQITYTRPAADKVPTPDNNSPITDTTYILWETGDGKKGYIAKNAYHNRTTTLRGLPKTGCSSAGRVWPTTPWTKAAEKALTSSFTPTTGATWTTTLTAKRQNSFDIGWAVDSLGNPVHLPGVDFIRVYTGVNQQCGWLGETSTELSRAEDLHVEDQTHYLPNP